MTLEKDEREKLLNLNKSLPQNYKLILNSEAKAQLKAISKNPPKKGLEFKIKATLTKLIHNPKYPGLNSHHYSSLDDRYGEKVWESYVENDCPGAYRIFWYIKGSIVVVLIIPHP